MLRSRENRVSTLSWEMISIRESKEVESGAKEKEKLLKSPDLRPYVLSIETKPASQGR